MGADSFVLPTAVLEAVPAAVPDIRAFYAVSWRIIISRLHQPDCLPPQSAAAPAVPCLVAAAAVAAAHLPSGGAMSFLQCHIPTTVATAGATASAGLPG